MYRDKDFYGVGVVPSSVVPDTLSVLGATTRTPRWGRSPPPGREESRDDNEEVERRRYDRRPDECAPNLRPYFFWFQSGDGPGPMFSGPDLW